MKNNLNSIYEKVANDKGISVNVVKSAYQLYWKCIMDHYREIPFDDETQTEEQLLSHQTYVRLPMLGELFVSFRKWKKRRGNLKTIRKKAQEGLIDKKYLTYDKNDNQEN